MNFILLQLLLAGRKIAQIGETERKQGDTLLSVTRRRTWYVDGALSKSWSAVKIFDFANSAHVSTSQEH